MTRFFASAAILVLASCVSAPDEPNGCIAYSPAVPLVAQLGRVCATQLDDHWAVSVKHGFKTLKAAIDPSDMVRSDDYDLVFFRHEGKAPEWWYPATGGISVGDPVTASGNPGSPLDYVAALPVPNREKATGKIIAGVWYCGVKDAPSKCTGAFAFDAPTRRGYSGGPVVDDQGRIVGIVVAHIMKPVTLHNGAVLPEGTALAFPASLVWSEFRRMVPAQGL